ncbi:class I SAM-dependent methyltransferase [Saccharomonospora saliphila]|uniref:class I SAM-dependent methyltransferase n=1 Tax=Saccharomonospora saliphila TaxID=369829 RepID=UPI00037EA382|nr:class I SAM-dependent methyltransferase [Saccharomonospora saliphila]
MTTTEIRFLDQRTPDEKDRPFLPGMGKTWLLPLYDAFARVTGVQAVYERTAALADIGPGHAVVDVGCGTGNLSLAVLAATREARVTGLDPDRDALRRAARKARRRGVGLTLVQGYADRIPADDSALDHVISSLALHHIDDESRSTFARDALRALRPGGTLTVADFGGDPAPGGDEAGRPAHGHDNGDGLHNGHGQRHDHGHGNDHGHGVAHTLRHLARLVRSRGKHNPAVDRAHGDSLVTLLTEAGFDAVREVEHLDHRFGRIAIVRATRPVDTTQGA